MSTINLLSSKIYNRIAAGEVVERPASVVKELVENSIDAGAKNITIEIEGGGISVIRIIDDGSGIEKSELNKALLPHATSKISKISDLDNISSLGFRGEALASIASVSKMKIESKPSNQELGACIFADGGEPSEVEDCGASNGTVITVNNLFFNTPVREKFLKSERSEESEISNTVVRFILGNPNVSFKYVADGKTIYQSYGDGFSSAMACVYGVKVMDDCYYVDTEKNGLKICGYFSKHHFTKGNRSYQTTFINGRYVENQTISSAISNAYYPYLMKRQYAFYVLSLNVPTEIVDVNVHPNKLDVRFTNNQIIYGSIYSVVSKVLDGSSEALDIVSKMMDTEKKPEEKLGDFNMGPFDKIIYDPTKPYPKRTKPFPNLGSVTFNDPIAEKNKEFNKFNTDNTKESGDKAVDIFAENKAFLEKLEKEKQQAKNLEQSVITIERELKLIGQALNTFLVLEDGVDMFFIDQHAAHERLLFDKINKSFSEKSVIKQPLLIPYILNVNNSEYQFVKEKSEILKDMGIEIEEFGRNAFKVSEVPTFLTEMNIQKFFDEVLGEIDTLRNFTMNDLLLEKFAQKACKSAIKSGDKLSDLELKTLLELLKNNLGLKCPHGRPVAIKITRTEIDKWFKRIV